MKCPGVQKKGTAVIFLNALKQGQPNIQLSLMADALPLKDGFGRGAVCDFDEDAVPWMGDFVAEQVVVGIVFRVVGGDVVERGCR